jgi:hypothetical protein
MDSGSSHEYCYGLSAHDSPYNSPLLKYISLGNVATASQADIASTVLPQFLEITRSDKQNLYSRSSYEFEVLSSSSR